MEVRFDHSIGEALFNHAAVSGAEEIRTEALGRSKAKKSDTEGRWRRKSCVKGRAGVSRC